jgi:biotin carboxyl carrier protein
MAPPHGAAVSRAKPSSRFVYRANLSYNLFAPVGRAGCAIPPTESWRLTLTGVLPADLEAFVRIFEASLHLRKVPGQPLLVRYRPLTDSGHPLPRGAEVIAPHIATFRRAPVPGAPRGAEVGQAISATTVIGRLEVLGQTRDLLAGIEGRIARILVEDGALVECGQVLFELEPDPR